MSNGANFTQRGFILGTLIGAMLRSLGALGLRHQPEFFLGSIAPGPPAAPSVWSNWGLVHTRVYCSIPGYTAP